MKHLLSFLILFVGLFGSAQVSNLTNLASGRMEMFVPIYEEANNVYGYFSLFRKDKLSEDEEKFEYIILDKNLNKVANGEFVDTYYKGVYSSYFKPEKVKNNLILTKQFSNLSGSIAFTSSRLLDLSSNAINEPFYFEGNTLYKGFRDAETLKKDQKSRPFFNLPIAADDGYVLIEGSKKSNKNNPSQIYYYNLQHEKLWDYDFGPENKKSEYRIATVDDGSIYFLYETKDLSNSSIKLSRIDIETGQSKFSYTLESYGGEYSYSYRIKKLADRTILTGKISPYNTLGYNKDKSLGLFKIVLDGDGNELFNKHVLWEEMSEFFDMNEKGKLEEGYKLFAHEYFVFNDERIIVLSEKYKIAYNLLLGYHIKTEDFILLEFDSEFNLVNGTAIEKDMSKFSNSDFLFAQYLNDESDAVFFYNDYEKDSETKDKNWILGIVSLIDGKVNHEKIPMISEEYSIFPYIAKEGYILLREFNKNSDFDKIRLERLNLD